MSEASAPAPNSILRKVVVTPKPVSAQKQAPALNIDAPKSPQALEASTSQMSDKDENMSRTSEAEIDEASDSDGEENNDDSQNNEVQETPELGAIPSFDWHEFDSSFHDAIAEATETQEEITKKFKALVMYFEAWSQAAAEHDNDRAYKRLKTRTHFVKLQEQSLEKKKQRYEEIVAAFTNALSMLSDD